MEVGFAHGLPVRLWVVDLAVNVVLIIQYALVFHARTGVYFQVGNSSATEI